MKFRKSRLPVVVALAAVLLGFAAYGIYRAVSLPRVHVTHVAKNWLDNTSGHHHRAVHHPSRHVAHHHRRHHSHLAHHHRKHHKARLAHHRKKRHYQTASYAE